MHRDVTPTAPWASDRACPRGIRSPNPAIRGTIRIAGSSMATEAIPTAVAPPREYATRTTAIHVANSIRSHSR